VVITLYKDKSFDFVVKSPPAATLLKQAAQIAKGSGEPDKEKVGKVTRQQCEEIAERKMKDLNAFDIKQAGKIIEGTARSMGIEVEG
jgi:large subunit ribosomal protein L11